MARATKTKTRKAPARKAVKKAAQKKKVTKRRKATTATAAKRGERFVMVTTSYKGVFAGWAVDTSGDSIHLRAGRACLYWDQDVGGFMGLAEEGPSRGCRIGACADIEVRCVTAVVLVTDRARRGWENAPTYRG